MKRAAWLVGGVLLLGLIALGVGLRLLHSRPRFVPDALLLDEVAGVELLDDPAPAGSDWPQWRGPNRDGVTSFPGLLREWDGTPKVLHRVKGGEGYSSFAVRGDLTWTMADQDGREALICLDLA